MSVSLYREKGLSSLVKDLSIFPIPLFRCWFHPIDHFFLSFPADPLAAIDQWLPWILSSNENTNCCSQQIASLYLYHLVIQHVQELILSAGQCSKLSLKPFGENHWFLPKIFFCQPLKKVLNLNSEKKLIILEPLVLHVWTQSKEKRTTVATSGLTKLKWNLE